MFTCFTLASLGYLGWLYHLMTLVPPAEIDVHAMGLGYLCQGLGIGIAMLLVRSRPGAFNRTLAIGAIVLLLTCAAFAMTADSLAVTLSFGFVMNVACGVVSAFYLLMLSDCVPAHRRGIVFGGGYACSALVAWILSLIPSLLPAEVPNELIWCIVFSIGVAVVFWVSPRVSWGDTVITGATENSLQGSTGSDLQGGNPGASGTKALSTVVLACVVVVLMSMVKNVGFEFPAADIGNTVNLETSRLLYAVGLVAAGIVIDRSRKYGATLCMAGLVVPFVMLALTNEPIPSAALWAIGYLLYGFFSVFRVVLFADIADSEGRGYLSGFGLMLGRFGDSFGTFACFLLADATIALVVVAGALFVATFLAFFPLFQRLYVVQPLPDESERRVFESFANRYELSRREQEVLELLRARKTNPEIAEALVLSENTVKFHVRNILRKTDCKNRTELLELYASLR